ncbi:hypothetical protein ABZP36_000278 [Zizania latifolia]
MRAAGGGRRARWFGIEETGRAPESRRRRRGDLTRKGDGLGASGTREPPLPVVDELVGSWCPRPYASSSVLHFFVKSICSINLPGNQQQEWP